MIIRDEHIVEAENLLINGSRFDYEERIPFIKNLNTCDLLAVPGSGKTTVLLAKLFCISKQLPFEDGSGILVLSHTNAAVDEIEKNLKKHCQNLFTYPNFIGTIQSFINKYLANPGNCQLYGSYISKNDDDVYLDEVIKFFLSLQWSKKGVKPSNLVNKLYFKANYGRSDLTPGEKRVNTVNYILNLKFDFFKKKIIGGKNNTIFTFNGATRDYYNELVEWKIKLLKKGVLSYYDSYSIGELYFNLFPEVIQILRERFRYIFIDEMQDLEKFQIDIIDKIFYEEGYSNITQRIGDINQSIYNSGKKVKVEADWVPRKKMYLTGSNRLTQEIASVVNFFTLDRQADEEGNPRFVVNGLRQLGNPIKPHIVLFDNASINKLETKFKELIMGFSLQGTREAQKYGFKIIGWNAIWDDNEDHSDKLRLENIFESYKKEAKSNKETYDSLSKYLQLFDHKKSTLEAPRKAVLNALIHVLRIEGKTYKVKIRGNVVSRYYSKDEMIKFIKNPENNCDYEFLKKLIYVCANRLVLRKQYENVYNLLKKFITNKFKSWFELVITQETLSFIGSKFENIIIENNVQTSEEDSHNEIKIDIGTVHSAKGQTHCATMYVETSYFDYETNKLKVLSKQATKTRAEEYLPNPLLKQEHAYRKGKDSRAKETLKMMYVGFSRPTHLLCFACLKENIANEIENYRISGWEIIDLTMNN